MLSGGGSAKKEKGGSCVMSQRGKKHKGKKEVNGAPKVWSGKKGQACEKKILAA